MDRSFRFLHASDLHLERSPGGLAEIPDHLHAEVAAAPYQAARRVFDAAVKHEVDFVVLAGDVVDLQLSGPPAVAFLGEQFGRLHDVGIKVYWAGSPTDHFSQFADAWPLPDGLRRFPLDRIVHLVHHRHDEPLVQILGTSSEQRVGGTQRTNISAADFRPDSSDLFSVAVAYGATDAESLAPHPIDYWALGGRHTRHSLLTEPATGHYCGTTQGRGPEEAGPRGCTLVQVDEDRRARTTFIPTDAVRYLDERVTVDALTTDAQLLEVLTHRVAELLVDPFGPELFVRWTVTGSRSLADRWRSGKVPAELVSRLREHRTEQRPGVWTVSLEAATAEDVAEERYDEETLLGEFLRTVRHYVDHPHEPLSLDTLLGERHRAGRLSGLAHLDEPEVRRAVLAEAAALGAALLDPREVGS